MAITGIGNQFVNTTGQRDLESARKGEFRQDDRATISPLGEELAEVPAETETVAGVPDLISLDGDTAFAAAESLGRLIAANASVASSAQANSQAGTVLALLQ